MTADKNNTTPHSTHEVFNQSTPFENGNLFRSNRALQDALKQHMPQLNTAELDALGALMGSSEMIEHARLANVHSPVLHTHDYYGHRIDQVEFHPSYHLLMSAALKHGLHASPWERGPGSHMERAAGLMLFAETEAATLCPVSMTYAVIPALRNNNTIYSTWGPKLGATIYDSRFLPFNKKTALTMGMGMTEKQGGSDVRANTTQASLDGYDAWGERWRIRGHKWFFSAPMCDAFLILAQTKKGLSCFFLPRFLPDGTLNSIEIQRLKHKLGNQANASSEVEFYNALAWLIGEEGRGIQQILTMGTLTRLDCALSTAGLMRQALSLTLHHTLQRHVFDKALISQPLMKNVLADLALESEAATALALRLAVAVDRSENGNDAYETIIRRLLTPVAKFWICKRGSHFTQETMECIGGNGYVEAAGKGVMARIYREMPLNSIWEGAGNIMALDLLRSLHSVRGKEALAAELSPAQGKHTKFDKAVNWVLQQVNNVPEEIQSRLLTRELALVWQAALLFQQAPEEVFTAFCNSRLDQRSDVFGLLSKNIALDAILQRAMPLYA